MAFLELRDVHKTFGPNHVLRGINLDVELHQVVCLIGASGSGKSTLLRCINQLETIDGGEIRLADDRVSGRGIDVDALRRDVGFVFQSFNLFPHMTVLQNVMLAPVKVLGLTNHLAEERGIALLKRIGLEEKAKEYPDRLSGGQQQRVAIVRALAMEPHLLLLDEITSALDPELVAEVLNIVRDLARDGMTMMLATHEMGFAKEVSSKVCFLHEGLIHEEGPPEQIFGDPQEERTRASSSSRRSRFRRFQFRRSRFRQCLYRQFQFRPCPFPRRRLYRRIP
jgi:polar amino acid transport system ATP-binding protein